MKIFTVDSFTDTPFTGNPAGVCILDKPFEDESLYQKISGEINYPETAFIVSKENGTFNLRWFTPTTEVEICGHATLAAAKVIFEKTDYSNEIINFNTLSGPLQVQQVDGKLEMNFPYEELSKLEQSSKGLVQFINNASNKVYANKQWRLVEFENEEKLNDFIPNFSAIENEALIVIITAKSNHLKFDFASRVFAPYYGIPEDPVTGSAHCYLGKYWSDLLQKKQVTGLQASKRTGIVSCEVISNNRILLGGDCVIMNQLTPYWL